MLLTVEGIEGEICYAIRRYAEANNKYMKVDDKNLRISTIETSSQ